MRQLFIMIIGLTLFAVPAMADASDEVKALLEEKIDAVVALLQNQDVEKSIRNKQIIDIIAPTFDYQAMARLSLGKKYWPTLTQEQKTAFSKLFTEKLQNSYLEKLDLYSDEKIIYGDTQTKGKKIHQPTTLISKDSRIGMLYKFYRSAEGWKIYDVEIGGVSVIQTYRSQFDGVLSEGTINDLLDKLSADGSFAIPAPDDTENLSGV